MSTFKTRKDRDRHGKPMPHWRVQYATLKPPLVEVANTAFGF